MKVSPWRTIALGASLLLVAACEPGGDSLDSRSAALSGADYTVALEGAGSESDAPLSGLVQVAIVDGWTAEIHVTNTSPETSSTVPDAPVLTRLGFNLADGPDADCLSLSVADDRFEIPRRIQPFCGRTPRLGDMFAYGFDAVNPRPANGIARDETLVFTLSVDPACGYELTAASFADAPESPSGGELTQWAAKYQVVGEGGEDSGCAQGAERRPPEYIWSEFVATGAEVDPLPSVFMADDTRAGSVELNYNGGFGFDGVTNDAPYTAGIAALRNGAGVLIEQWQVNRLRFPGALDADGCSFGTPFPQCWLWGLGGVATVQLPTYATDSNDGFDPGSTSRVTVSAESTIDDTVPADDNSNQWFTITWTDPSGIDTARLHLRLHYDANLNDMLGDDPLYSLYRVRFPGDGPDMIAPVVNVIAETETSVTVEVNVQDAVDYVWDIYLGLPGYLP